MQAIFTPLGYIIAGLYLTISILCAALFRSHESEIRLPARTLAVVTAGIHLLYIGQIVYEFRRLPLASVYEALTFTALVLAILYLFIQYTSKESGTGLFFFPVIFILQTIAAFNLSAAVPPGEINPLLASPYFALHTVPSILGYAAFLISLKYSTMYLLMNYQIQSRTFGLLYAKLPSLEGLDNLNKKAVMTGFTLLTIGIITGWLWAENVWQSQTANNPKVAASFLLWILYGISIPLRYFRGWQGKRAAYLSVLGGILLLLSFFVI